MAKAGDGKPRSDMRRATQRVTKRVTNEELSMFQKRAAEAGFALCQDYLSAFIAGDIRLQAATRKETIRLLGELGKLGSNVNQIARALNMGRTDFLNADALHTLEATRALIEALSQEVREALL
jgi:uncharacterized protein YehS (DUF1456 family)